APEARVQEKPVTAIASGGRAGPKAVGSERATPRGAASEAARAESVVSGAVAAEEVAPDEAAPEGSSRAISEESGTAEQQNVARSCCRGTVEFWGLVSFLHWDIGHIDRRMG